MESSLVKMSVLCDVNGSTSSHQVLPQVSSSIMANLIPLVTSGERNELAANRQLWWDCVVQIVFDVSDRAVFLRSHALEKLLKNCLMDSQTPLDVWAVLERLLSSCLKTGTATESAPLAVAENLRCFYEACSVHDTTIATSRKDLVDVVVDAVSAVKVSRWLYLLLWFASLQNAWQLTITFHRSMLTLKIWNRITTLYNRMKLLPQDTQMPVIWTVNRLRNWRLPDRYIEPTFENGCTISS